jgi:hypothetical protein
VSQHSPLASGVEQRLLELASGAHLLLFGELHGTQELPALVASLLPRLIALGYGGLALEVPHDQRDALLAWGSGESASLPPFFSLPSRDGRGNLQALELARDALGLGLQVLCFDHTTGQAIERWAERDERMARNLLQQWASSCPGRRVVGICGGLHARLAPEAGVGRLVRQAIGRGGPLWPSLAGWVQQFQPTASVGSVQVRFQSGEFFNMGVRTIYGRPGTHDQPWLRDAAPAYSLELWLPRASCATFLSEPT